MDYLAASLGQHGTAACVWIPAGKDGAFGPNVAHVLSWSLGGG